MWRADIGDHQGTRREYAAMVAQATRPRADGTRPRAVLYHLPAVRATGGGAIMAGTLRMMVRQARYGVVPRWCAGAECSGSPPPRRPVVDLGTVVGIVVPPPPAWL